MPAASEGYSAVLTACILLKVIQNVAKVTTFAQIQPVQEVIQNVAKVTTFAQIQPVQEVSFFLLAASARSIATACEFVSTAGPSPS